MGGQGGFDWEGLNQGLAQVGQGARIGRQEREDKAERERVRLDRENERRLKLAEIRLDAIKATNPMENDPGYQAALKAYEDSLRAYGGEKGTAPILPRKTIPGRVVTPGQPAQPATPETRTPITARGGEARAEGVGTQQEVVTPGTPEQPAVTEVREPGQEIIAVGGTRNLTDRPAHEVYQSIYNTKLTPQQQAYLDDFRARQGRDMTFGELQHYAQDPKLQELFPPPTDPRAIRTIYQSNVTRMRSEVDAVARNPGATPQNIASAMARYNQAAAVYRQELIKHGFSEAEAETIVQPYTDEQLQIAIRSQGLAARHAQQAGIANVRSASAALGVTLKGNSEAMVREAVADVNRAREEIGQPPMDVEQAVRDWRARGAPTGGDPVKLIQYKIANNIELEPGEVEFMKRFPHKFQSRGRAGGGKTRRQVY